MKIETQDITIQISAKFIMAIGTLISSNITAIALIAQQSM